MRKAKLQIAGLGRVSDIHGVIGFLAVMSCTIGCDRVVVPQQPTEEVTMDWYDEYAKRYEQQLQQAEQQAKQTAAQQSRFDAVLTRWEEHAERVDALPDRWDRILVVLEEHSGDR